MVWVPRTPEVYLPPGGLYAGDAPCVIKAVVGSCVAVTLYSRALAVGGMSHFVLPRGSARGEAGLRFGETALELLHLRMSMLGAGAVYIEARVFGGAAIGTAAGESGSLGAHNVHCARRWLHERRIPIVEENVLGNAARRVVLDLSSGATAVSAVVDPT